MGKTYGSSRAVQKKSSDWHHEGGCKGGNCIPKDSPNDLWWNLMNSQGNEWNLLNSQNTKIALEAKVLLR